MASMQVVKVIMAMHQLSYKFVEYLCVCALLE